MKRILCVSQEGIELRRFCRNYDVQVLGWPEQGLYGPDAPPRIQTVCAQVSDLAGIDCIICENISSAPVMFQLRRSGYGGPVVMVPHVNPYPTRNLLHTLLWSEVWGPRDVVVAGSAVTARRYESFFGLRSKPIATFGVDETVYFQREKGQSKRQFGLFSGPVLLYTGRFAGDKNIGALLAAYRSIRKSVLDAQLVMAVTFKDDAYWDCLSEQLEGVTILERLEPTVLAELYSAADVFVSSATSYFETFGRSPLEAIACGTPVVVPDWDGFRSCLGVGARLVAVDFLDAPLYEGWSYAMVDLPAVVRACLDVLSNPPPEVGPVGEGLTSSATERRFNELVLELTASAKPVVWRQTERLRAASAPVQKVVDALGVTDLERLFDLTTCAAEELPALEPAARRELYMELFS